MLKKIRNVGLFLFLLLFVLVGCSKHSLNMKQKSVDVEVGEKITISPEYNAKDTLKFVSKDETIATCDKGVITGVKVGKTTIVVSLVEKEDMKIEVEINVVDKKAKALILTTLKEEVPAGEKVTLELTYTPDDAVTELHWTSSDETVATVSDKGVVTAIKEGSIKISVVDSRSGKQTSVDLKVVAAEAEDLNVKADAEMQADATLTITATKVPENSSGKIVFTSKTPDIATVSDKGVVTAVKGGTATITVSVEGTGVKKDINITVNYLQATGVDITGDKKVLLGEKTTLAAGVTPAKAYGAIKWEVNNTEKATITQEGELEALQEGLVYVTATVIGTDISNKYVVEIYKKAATAISAVKTLEIPVNWEEELSVNVTPSDAMGTIIYRSDDAGIVKVDNNGTMTSGKEGTTKVRAYIKGNNFEVFEAVITVTVKAGEPDSIKFGEIKETLYVGNKFKVPASVEPYFAKQEIEWEVSPATNATIDANTGELTLLKKGKITVTAKAKAKNSVLGSVELEVKERSIIYAGTSTTITENIYPTIAEALTKVTPGGILYILPGTYNENVNITTDNLTIISDNADKQESQRTAEAIIQGKITLKYALKDLVIKGFKFEGQAQIINTKGTEKGSKDDLKTNLQGFLFQNNLVSSSLTSGKGFIQIEENNWHSQYNHNIVIKENTFDGTGLTSKAMVYISNPYDITMDYNVFQSIDTDAIYIHDDVKGLSGLTNSFSHNLFDTIKGNALWVNWMSPLPLGSKTSTVLINSNDFTNIDKTAIRLGRMNNSDKYKAIEIMHNTFTTVNVGLDVDRVHQNAHMAFKNNVFNDIPNSLYVYSHQNQTYSPCTLDATDNLYYKDGSTITPDAAKFKSVKTDKSKNETDYPGGISFETNINGVKPTSIKIKGKKLTLGETTKLEIEYTPSNPLYKKVKWESNNPAVVSVDSEGNVTAWGLGTAVISVSSEKNPAANAAFGIEVTEYEAVEVRYEGTGVIKPKEVLLLEITVISLKTPTLVCASENPEIATVTAEGVVTGISEGVAKIIVKDIVMGKEVEIFITVKAENTMNKLLQLLVDNSKGVIMNRNIQYVGFESGYQKKDNRRVNVYGSVNRYWATELPEIIQHPLDYTDLDKHKNVSGEDITEIKYITVHDTASAGEGKGALSMAKWCTNVNNDNTSWHYSVGNDGIYQQLPDTKVAWHGGDGAEHQMCDVDSGVKATNNSVRPHIIIGDDGYFVINGQKSKILAPDVTKKGEVVRKAKTSDITELGLLTVIGENGNYFMSPYFNETYGFVATYGGINTVAMETCVNLDSDVYLTWQKAAKLVATLQTKHNLDYQRYSFHNNISGKPCPNTMITNGLTDEFAKMIELEWRIMNEYKGWKITFESSNTSILDNTGRVVGSGPAETTSVPYTITVSKGDKTESITLSTIVVGQRNH